MADTLPSTRPSGLLREREGTVPNTVALTYATLGHAGGLVLLTSPWPAAVVLGVLLTLHTMVIAAYLIHEAAHYTLFREGRHNRWTGELMAWICGAAYASFERIRHMHLRHHRDRADVTVYDYKALLRRHPMLLRAVRALEWMHVPAVELIMHYQILLRPFTRPAERQRRTRIVVVLATRITLFAGLYLQSPWALAGYVVAYGLLLKTLDFFDAYHHTFEQYFTQDETVEVPLNGRDRAYEQANTYSNVVSLAHPWVNLLTLNFGYHNAHHERAAVPWYRLPALSRELFGESAPLLLPLRELLTTFHRHRLRRILDDDYGFVGTGPGRANDFAGAHGVSFLTVV